MGRPWSFLGAGLTFVVLGGWALGSWYASNWALLGRAGGVLVAMGVVLVSASLFFPVAGVGVTRWQTRRHHLERQGKPAIGSHVLEEAPCENIGADQCFVVLIRYPAIRFHDARIGKRVR